MISEIEIEKLAALSRIELSKEEVERMKKDMGAILAYVDQLKKAPGGTSTEPVMSFSKNVIREDEVKHEPGSFKESLLNLSPKREVRFLLSALILFPLS